ncbi:MAG: uracil-DNA glycosylase Ung [Pseudomonadota bacterium]
MTADDLPAVYDTLPPAWAAALPGWTRGRWAEVVDQVRAVSGGRPIGPPDPLRALRLTAPDDVRVVVFGQDPYPGAGHADGLAFSAGRGKPVSLRRVFSVLAADRPGFAPPADWALDAWARQGVLLLNPVLSVEIGRAGSHLECGWQALTSEIVKVLAVLEPAPDFLLWGSKAQAFFDAACPPGAPARVWRTRHPSHDFRREFMGEGSHFTATAHRVDWWALAGR